MADMTGGGHSTSNGKMEQEQKESVNQKDWHKESPGVKSR